MTIFIILLWFQFNIHEVSIWVRPEFKDCTVFVDSNEQFLLSNSTPSNRRFKTKKSRFELMIATKTDTIRKKVELIENLTVIPL